MSPPAPSSLAGRQPAQQILGRIGAQFKIILDNRLRREAVAVALACLSPLARRGRLGLRQALRRKPETGDGCRSCRVLCASGAAPGGAKMISGVLAARVPAAPADAGTFP